MRKANSRAVSDREIISFIRVYRLGMSLAVFNISQGMYLKVVKNQIKDSWEIQILYSLIMSSAVIDNIVVLIFFNA